LARVEMFERAHEKQDVARTAEANPNPAKRSK
jgi:hypothetical protein